MLHRRQQQINRRGQTEAPVATESTTDEDGNFFFFFFFLIFALVTDADKLELLLHCRLKLLRRWTAI